MKIKKLAKAVKSVFKAEKLAQRAFGEWRDMEELKHGSTTIKECEEAELKYETMDKISERKMKKLRKLLKRI